MQPKDYFKKTFVFSFNFYFVYKTVGLIMNRFVDFNLEFVLKTLIVAVVAASILGVINYFTKIGFTKKQ